VTGALDQVAQWPVSNAAAAVVAADGRVLGAVGDDKREYYLASVTKLLTAYTVLIAVEEGVFELDTPAGPEGATVRDLLAHTAGVAFSQRKVVAAPRTRRLYSSAGFDMLAEALTEHADIAFDTYQQEALLTPLGMTSTRLAGSPGADGYSTVADLVRFAHELQRPTLISPQTLAEATTVQFPGLNGVLPGFGHQRPNDWGLGFELRDHKDPHWTGSTSSPRTFGHFGQSGTFLWIDPEAGLGCVTLTDRDFGDWAKEAWPRFTDAVLAEYARR
jgi:CubicO group peptidase (beta-lactamase class C family)